MRQSIEMTTHQYRRCVFAGNRVYDTEVVTLRAPDQNEIDFEPELEGETWCPLSERGALRQRLALRFLVRRVTPYLVTVGGINVGIGVRTNNDGRRPRLDLGMPVTTRQKDLHTTMYFSEESGYFHIITKQKESKRRDCRVAFKLAKGQGFEIAFSSKGVDYIGLVELVDIVGKPESKLKSAHYKAKFEIELAQA